jgi:hypothetical protein
MMKNSMTLITAPTTHSLKLSDDELVVALTGEH